MKNLETLSIQELREINGGISLVPTKPVVTWPIIVPLGDPQDWDPYFNQLPL